MNIQTLLNQAIFHFERGNYSHAKIIAQNILKVQPNNFDTIFLIGILYGIENNHLKAVEFLKKAVKLNPHHHLIQFNYAKALSELGDHNNAIKHHLKAISLNPHHLETLVSYGKSLFELKKYSDSIAIFDKAIDLYSNSFESWYNKGLALNGLEKYEAAFLCFKECVLLRPEYCHAWHNIGVTLNKLNKFSEALIYFDKTIELDPYHARAFSNKGVALENLKRYDEALLNLSQAITLNPNLTEAWYNKAATLANTGKYNESLIHYNQTLLLEPNHVRALTNKGVLLSNQKEYNKAIDYFNKAILLDKNAHLAFWNKSLAKLILGEYDEGFELYEYRWKRYESEIYRHASIEPLTQTTNINNKKVLIWYEQGFGDTIQFSRYIPFLEAQGAKITFEVQKPLISLIKDSLQSEITDKVSNIDDFDYQLPLLSLPKIFKNQFKKELPPCLPINISLLKIQSWKSKLNLSNQSLNIGLAFSGNPNHLNDSNRSMRLAELDPLLKKFNFYLLQKEAPTEDLNLLESTQSITNLGPQIMDFQDTAAIIRNLDLIISVDTSLIHLAGSLNKKAFLMLPFAPDWRWLSNKSDSPWYPSIKIFRQNSPGNWKSVIEQIEKELQLAGLCR